MKQILGEQLQAIKVRELGLDPAALDLTSTEALAAALRRAASLLCPASPRTLVRAISDPLRGLVPNLAAVEDRIDETLEAIVAYGDLIESATETQADKPVRYLLHPAAPSFVPRENGAVLLVGVMADTSVFPTEIASRIEHVNHVRRLAPQLAENLVEVLVDYGMLEQTAEAWRQEPTRMTAAHLLRQLDDGLNAMGPARDIPGLTLLDPGATVTSYRGRWGPPKKQTGRFVARRGQSYGADLWCYVQMKNGYPERMIDLPFFDSGTRGCDEAWRAQMAIDATRAQPQLFGIRKATAGQWIMEFYSPVPMWARRRWDAIAEPIAASGCLFAYRIPASELEEEHRFLRESLWLSEKT